MADSGRLEEQRFLPGIPTASGVNRALVSNSELDRPVEYCGQSDLGRRLAAEADLANKRELARLFGPLALRGTLPVVESDVSWRGLVNVTTAWADKRIGQIDWTSFVAKRNLNPFQVRFAVGKAMADGVTTAKACLEVVPRSLAHRRFDQPNAEIARPWGIHAKGMVLEWLGLHKGVDHRLAYAVSEIRPPSRNIFDVLRFDPQWFVADDAQQIVRLDPLQVPYLRARDDLHPLAVQPEGEVLFGCPARRIIPYIFDAMHTLAERYGLFAETYWIERARLGYADAAHWRDRT